MRFDVKHGESLVHDLLVMVDTMNAEKKFWHDATLKHPRAGEAYQIYDRDRLCETKGRLKSLSYGLMQHAEIAQRAGYLAYAEVVRDGAEEGLWRLGH